MVEVKVEICRDGAVMPFYAHSEDAGMDICAAEEVIVHPGETTVIPTGLKLAIPEGYEIQVRPRSGISLNTPLRITNSPGTIDSGYRDELGIILTNTSPEVSELIAENNTIPPAGADSGFLTIRSKGNLKGTYKINKGDRIAQIVLQLVPRMKLIPVSSVNDFGNDRGGGFGSTGVR
jgi:dUTP pyrophosphatase